MTIRNISSDTVKYDDPAYPKEKKQLDRQPKLQVWPPSANGTNFAFFFADKTPGFQQGGLQWKKKPC
ncbi:MAG: hypothetical protein GY854_08125 [Deltaproteobacteria bacterium]|nr:hypothetical protein [Deltaproteobacteria bacterium]